MSIAFLKDVQTVKTTPTKLFLITHYAMSNKGQSTNFGSVRSGEQEQECSPDYITITNIY